MEATRIILASSSKHLTYQTTGISLMLAGMKVNRHRRKKAGIRSEQGPGTRKLIQRNRRLFHE